MVINTLRSIHFNVINFIRNQFYNIMMLVLVVSILNTLISYILISFNEKLLLSNIIIEHSNLSLHQFIQQLSLEQQYLLLKVSIINTITNLINNIFIISGILTIIKILKCNSKEQIKKILFSLLIKKLPKLIVLIFLLTIIIQFGLLLIIPGIILMIVLSFSPIILFTNKISISKSIYNSIIISINNFKLVYPIIILWFVIKIILLMMITRLVFITPSLATNIILNIINNLLLSILIIYIFRLYLFLNKQ
ncbi:MAG: YciC family protein [Candidatus Lightella neohaematopini]|nr:YciC family protein [Candidatus Lightella neohaematopini]MCV2528986.1 YciC family protein [Candidatus Lightella neohaematopini]